MNKDTTIGVFEIRRAKNGWVITAIEAHYSQGNEWNPRGYHTYLVQSNSPKEMAAVLDQAFKDFPTTEEIHHPPARKLP